MNQYGEVHVLQSYLVKVNYRFRMDPYKLQARPVALEELCKQPEKDSSHLLVLEQTNKSMHARTHTRHIFRVMSCCVLTPILHF